MIENLESTAYGMMLDSHQGFVSKDQYEEFPQMVHQEVSATQQDAVSYTHLTLPTICSV